MAGLPASGKTTLARPLSIALGLPLLDKDDVLEMLLDSLGTDSPEARGRSSRASDAVMQRVAEVAPGAVLSSFWRRESLSGTSGPPTQWLLGLPALVEVHCDCPARTAAERYHARVRHPGHFDQDTSFGDRVRVFERLAATLPLDTGPVVRVDTTGEVDVPAVAAAVQAAFARAPAAVPRRL